VYGFNFEKKNIEIWDNTEDEILKATIEFTHQIRGDLVFAERELNLMKKFNQLPYENGMIIKYEKNLKV